MAQGLNWERDGRHWPHRERSHFVAAAGLRWHVQHWPAPAPGAPLLLLIHGTGSATHTWRHLAPVLAPHFELLAMDLPGHGFSGPAVADSHGHGASLGGMARGVTALLATCGAGRAGCWGIRRAQPSPSAWRCRRPPPAPRRAGHRRA